MAPFLLAFTALLLLPIGGRDQMLMARLAASFVLFAAALLATGCATLAHGSRESISIVSASRGMGTSSSRARPS